jgi:hypothetical protein
MKRTGNYKLFGQAPCDLNGGSPSKFGAIRQNALFSSTIFVAWRCIVGKNKDKFAGIYLAMNIQ